MCFGLMLGPKSTYLHDLCGSLLYTDLHDTCRGSGVWKIYISFFVSLSMRIQNVSSVEKSCK